MNSELDLKIIYPHVIYINNGIMVNLCTIILGLSLENESGRLETAVGIK